MLTLAALGDAVHSKHFHKGIFLCYGTIILVLTLSKFILLSQPFDFLMAALIVTAIAFFLKSWRLPIQMFSAGLLCSSVVSTFATQTTRVSDLEQVYAITIITSMFVIKPLRKKFGQLLIKRGLETRI